MAARPPRRRPRRTPAEHGLRYEDVRFRARDGVTLAGWWVPAGVGEPRGAIILCHAYACNREQWLPSLPILHAHGYDVLMFDFRAHGESSGDRTTIGPDETDDVLGAVDWVCGRVIVLGLSMGGAAAILAAEQEPRIAAVVADSVFPSLAQAIEQRVRLSFGLFAAAAQPQALGVWRRLHGVDPATVAPERAIAKLSPRPVLVVHCGLDFYLSEHHARTLFDAAGEPREFWRVEAALHARAHATYPDAYMARVLEFLQRHGL